MRLTIHVLGLTALTACACAPPPGDKVMRRATAAEMPGAVVAPPVAEPEPAPEVTPPPQAPAERQVRACTVLIQRACKALGQHSDECQEARSLLPKVVTPEHHAGCQSILEVHVEPRRSGTRGRRLNPCRRLIRAVCRDTKATTWMCKQTRKDASRLWRTGHGEACLGDLLLVEARRVFSAQRGAD